MAINYAWNVSTVDTYPTKDSNSDVVYNRTLETNSN